MHVMELRRKNKIDNLITYTFMKVNMQFNQNTNINSTCYNNLTRLINKNNIVKNHF